MNNTPHLPLYQDITNKYLKLSYYILAYYNVFILLKNTIYSVNMFIQVLEIKEKLLLLGSKIEAKIMSHVII